MESRPFTIARTRLAGMAFEQRAALIAQLWLAAPGNNGAIIGIAHEDRADLEDGSQYVALINDGETLSVLIISGMYANATSDHQVYRRLLRSLEQPFFTDEPTAKALTLSIPYVRTESATTASHRFAAGLQARGVEIRGVRGLGTAFSTPSDSSLVVGTMSVSHTVLVIVVRGHTADRPVLCARSVHSGDNKEKLGLKKPPRM
jgi:hypothetical protein